jgi:hypothetical protein
MASRSAAWPASLAPSSRRWPRSWPIAADRASVVGRIRKLRAQAASTTFAAEARSFRAKAAELQREYGIKAEELRPPKTPPPAAPVAKRQIPPVDVEIGIGSLRIRFRL